MAEQEDSTSSAERSSFIDDEVAGKHGTVAASSSLEDEKQTAFHPQTPKEAAQKIRGGTEADSGLLGTAKNVVQELDRQVSGEYEHREDEEASASPDAGAVHGGDTGDA